MSRSSSVSFSRSSKSQEADDITRNRVTILVEGRWTPLVNVPSAFAVADLAA